MRCWRTGRHSRHRYHHHHHHHRHSPSQWCHCRRSKLTRGGGVPPRKRPPPPMRMSHHRHHRCRHHRRRRMAIASSTSPWNPPLPHRHTCVCSEKRPLELPPNEIFLVSIAVYMESSGTLPMRRAPLFIGEVRRLNS
jgi:hypothetical protein